MRNYNDILEADVQILPRSGTLIHTINASDPRDNFFAQYSESSPYLEQLQQNNFLIFDKYRIEPNGIDNNFPINYKNLLDSVYLGHGVKRTLINLLLSGGVGLYKEVKEEKKIIKDWQLDSEVTNWLESFNFFNEYIPEAVTDMIYLENNYTLFQRNKGVRIGKTAKIAGLKLLPVENMRLEYPNERGQRTKVFHSQWYYNQLEMDSIQAFPIFDRRYPFKHKNSVMFIKMPTFGSSSYGRPPEIGATQMLKVLSLLPNFHKANLTEKGFKWIVSISQNYYKAIRDKYKWEENSKEFKEWKIAYIQRIDDFLSAPDGDKIQTRFMTEFATDPHSLNTVDAVKITKLEDDTKELSEVGMDLHDTYTVAFTSASSIHPQLANINLKNHALSGSNLREAYEMHIKTATPTMRMLLLQPVNTALKINFPGKNLKIGFQDIAFENYDIKNTTKATEIK